MTKTAKQFVGMFLIVAVLGVLTWRLWPDGGQARQQQRNSHMVCAVVRNRLADATRLLDEGQTRTPKYRLSTLFKGPNGISLKCRIGRNRRPGGRWMT